MSLSFFLFALSLCLDNSCIAKTTANSPSDGRTDQRLGRLVRVLTDHATVVMSGTKLAAELDTTRSAVWRMVQQLRAMGVDVAGHSATGYQLKTVPDLLLPDVLDPLIRSTRFAA